MDLQLKHQEGILNSPSINLADTQNGTSLICFDNTVPGNYHIKIILICQDYSNIYIIYSLLSVVLSAILVAIWIIRRDWFPLKERSPTLIIQSLIGNMLFQLSYPLTYLYVQSNGEEVLNEPSFTLYFFSALYHFGSANFFIPYVWRYNLLENINNCLGQLD
jgi:hypothetical protein